MSEEWTTCAACKRVVFVEDVDNDGYCCFCEKAVEEESIAPKRKKTKKVDD